MADVLLSTFGLLMVLALILPIGLLEDTDDDGGDDDPRILEPRQWGRWE